jgi:hypothetical protein
VQVRAHPQTVFIQQPLGQRMQPQTIAVSQLTKPKYGARVRALYTYQASSSSQLAFKSVRRNSSKCYILGCKNV